MKIYDCMGVHQNRMSNKTAMIDWHSKRKFTYAQMDDRVAKLAGFMNHDLNV